MSKLPSMPFFPADFFADTRHLTGEQQGIYAIMLFHAWLSDGKLPSDDRVLLRILRLNRNYWNKRKHEVMAFWEPDENGNISQKRLKKDWKNIAEKNEVNRANGTLGGRPKSLFSKKPIKANGFNLETQTKGNQNQNHILKDSFNGELRQESRWVPTKRIGSRLFKVGELAPAYDGQPPRNWKTLKPEDCQ